MVSNGIYSNLSYRVLRLITNKYETYHCEYYSGWISTVSPIVEGMSLVIEGVSAIIKVIGDTLSKIGDTPSMISDTPSMICDTTLMIQGHPLNDRRHFRNLQCALTFFSDNIINQMQYKRMPII